MQREDEAGFLGLDIKVTSGGGNVCPSVCSEMILKSTLHLNVIIQVRDLMKGIGGSSGEQQRENEGVQVTQTETCRPSSQATWLPVCLLLDINPRRMSYWFHHTFLNETIS